LTLNYFAVAANVVIYWHHQQRIGNAAVLWVLAVIATLVVSWKVTTWWGKTDKAVARSAFLFLMWSILMLTYLMSVLSG